MLQDLDTIPWADLEHAYGSAADVPDLLRKLLDPDPKVRSSTLWTLYGNVFHQGTRYPATPYVIPFLIEMCANPSVPNRHDLLHYWGSLITGYFNVQERPSWGDGEKIYWHGEVQETDWNDPYSVALHQIYQESLKGHELLCDLLISEELGIRAEAAWVLACLPTMSDRSLPKLEAQIHIERSGWVRAAIAFTLGELGASASLHRLASEDAFDAVRCMASCQLARIKPSEQLIEPLILFVSSPIDGYEGIPGACGKSTDDAAFSISYLPAHVRQMAIPAICDRLDRARLFDTIPLANALLTAAFQRRDELLTELTDLQREVLLRMVNTEELWSIANSMWTFRAYGLPHNRDECAKLVGITVVNDKALTALRSGLAFAQIGFLEKACEDILQALEINPTVFEEAPAPDECWLLCAKAFAESEPRRAISAFQRAVTINPSIARRVDPTWHLADLLKEAGLG